MKPTNIQSLMETTLETIKGSIDTNTIIGDPIKTEDTVVVPISKVTIGFGIGGGEYSRGHNKKSDNIVDNEKNDTNFAGGSAGAISVQPVAFVVVENGETRLIGLDDNVNLVDNILAVTPKVIETIQNISKNKDLKTNKHKDSSKNKNKIR
ncbi:MAG: GerW family sporulation protein [Romboutsia sp.]|nr:GerW family sporulation protein [Romboutsia sp.]